MNPLQQNLERLIELVNDTRTKKDNWLKHIILMASSLLGILVALHPAASIAKESLEHLFFVLTICALSLGILSGGVALYGEVHTADSLASNFRKQVSESLSDSHIKILVSSGVPLKIFSRSEKLSYLFFSLALILVVIYVAF